MPLFELNPSGQFSIHFPPNNEYFEVHVKQIVSTKVKIK